MWRSLIVWSKFDTATKKMFEVWSLVKGTKWSYIYFRVHASLFVSFSSIFNISRCSPSHLPSHLVCYLCSIRWCIGIRLCRKKKKKERKKEKEEERMKERKKERKGKRKLYKYTGSLLIVMFEWMCDAPFLCWLLKILPIMVWCSVSSFFLLFSSFIWFT